MHVVRRASACRQRAAPGRWCSRRLRRGAAAVQVDHGRHRKFVAVPDDRRPAAAGLDGRAGEGALVAPDRRAQPGQDLRGGLPLDDLVPVGVRVLRDRRQHRRDRQRHLERRGQRHLAGEQFPGGRGAPEQPRPGDPAGDQHTRAAGQAEEPAPGQPAHAFLQIPTSMIDAHRASATPSGTCRSSAPATPAKYCPDSPRNSSRLAQNGHRVPPRHQSRRRQHDLRHREVGDQVRAEPVQRQHVVVADQVAAGEHRLGEDRDGVHRDAPTRHPEHRPATQPRRCSPSLDRSGHESLSGQVVNRPQRHRQCPMLSKTRIRIYS